MKRYIYNGLCYWFDPDKAPAGAVEVKPKQAAPKPEPEAKAKAVKPANKARKAATK